MKHRNKFQKPLNPKPGKRTIGALIVLFFLFSTIPVDAQLRFCNKGSDNEASNIAIAYYANRDWISKGWYIIPPGECITVLSAISNRYIYYYDASNDLDLTKAMPIGEEVAFCISPQAFTIHKSHNCINNEHLQKPFTLIDAGNNTRFQVDLLLPAQIQQGIVDVVRTSRKSMINNSRVMIMRNTKPHFIGFSLVCSRSNGLSKTFNISIQPYGTSELGFLQGWPENFLPGDQCTAFWEGAIVWTFKPY